MSELRLDKLRFRLAGARGARRPWPLHLTDASCAGPRNCCRAPTSLRGGGGGGEIAARIQTRFAVDWPRSDHLRLIEAEPARTAANLIDGRVAIVPWGQRARRARACARPCSPRCKRWWSTNSVARATAPAARLAPRTRWPRNRKAGGEAISDGADVSNFDQVEAMVAQGDRVSGGSVDLLVANAGILRDKSFAKMSRTISGCRRRAPDRHLQLLQAGGMECASATMAATSSPSFDLLAGNFWPGRLTGAAKAAMAGLMNAGGGGPKTNIRVLDHYADRGDPMTEELPAAPGAAVDETGIDHACGAHLASEDAPDSTISGSRSWFLPIKIMERAGHQFVAPTGPRAAVAAHFKRRSATCPEGPGAGRASGETLAGPRYMSPSAAGARSRNQALESCSSDGTDVAVVLTDFPAQLFQIDWFFVIAHEDPGNS